MMASAAWGAVIPLLADALLDSLDHAPPTWRESWYLSWLCMHDGISQLHKSQRDEWVENERTNVRSGIIN